MTVTAGPGGLEALAQGWLWLHFIVLLRTGPILALFPGIGDGGVSTRIKMVLALALTAAVTPILAPILHATAAAPPPLALLVLSETAVGLLIGLGLRLFIVALQTAGAIAAQSTSLSQLAGNTGPVPVPAMGQFLVTGGIALAMTLGMHLRVAELTVLSYRVFPPAQFPDGAALAQWGIRQTAGAFALAFTLAGPFILVAILYNLALGVINRAMPQLMVVFIGAPVITAAGLVLLLMLGPVMLQAWAGALNAWLANPFGGP